MNLIKLIDKFNQSSKGKVVKSVFMFLASVFMVVFVCVAYSWFVKQVNVGSTGMGVGTQYTVMNAHFSSFYIDNLDTKDVVKGNQYTDAQGHDVLDIRLLPYDMTFTSTHQYAPIVVRIQIYDVTSNFIPTGNQSKNLSLIISRNTNLSFATSSSLDEYFSSVGQIGCYTNTSLALNASYSTIYSTIVTQYRADQNVMRFTTQSNSTYTKSGYLTKSISYTASNFFTDSNSDTCLVLYLCFDYNETLADAYAEQQSATSASLENKFDMVNDISTINVDFV